MQTQDFADLFPPNNQNKAQQGLYKLDKKTGTYTSDSSPPPRPTPHYFQEAKMTPSPAASSHQPIDPSRTYPLPETPGGTNSTNLKSILPLPPASQNITARLRTTIISTFACTAVSSFHTSFRTRSKCSVKNRSDLLFSINDDFKLSTAAQVQPEAERNCTCMIALHD